MAVAGDAPLEPSVVRLEDLGTSWTVLGPIPANEVSSGLDCRTLSECVTAMKVGGIGCDVRDIKVPGGRLDFAKLFWPGAGNEKRTFGTGDRAFLFAKVICDEDVDVLIGTGADWWMRWSIDGVCVFDTLSTGNQSHDFSCLDHAFRVHLASGGHLVCVEVRSGSMGWSLAATADPQRQDELQAVLRKQDEEHLAEEERRNLLLEKARVASRMKLVVFGSSVALGAGADDLFGWANRLGETLQSRNWEFVNRSVGGDSTVKLMARFEEDLLVEHPDVVIIGLSLANEGLLGNPEEVYEQYARNMRKLIQMCRKNGIVPVVANCYPNNSYNAEHDAYVRKFNAELNRWPVASIDLLGTVDDGTGRWQADCWRDGGHPNDCGHAEMVRAVPPTLFDNLIDPTYPLPTPVDVWLATAEGAVGAEALLTCRPEFAMRSFSFCFTVKPQQVPPCGSVLAAVDACAVVVDDSGVLACVLPNGCAIRSAARLDPSRSCVLGMTYSACGRRLKFYVDGVEAGAAEFEFEPDTFFLGGGKDAGGPQAMYKDCLIYRSCLDADNMALLASGTWLRSSLQLLAPLDDTVLFRGLPVGNRAQTGARMILGSRACRRVARP